MKPTASGRIELVVKGLTLVLGCVAAILILGLTLLPSVAGYRTYIVLSGSMSPAIPTGAVVVAVPVDPTTLKVGDVITYNRSDIAETITHRIVAVSEDGATPSFSTRGDANAVNDPWTVQFGATAGKVVLSVPFVGYLYHALGTRQGHLFLVIIPVSVLLALWLLQIWRPSDRPAAPRTADETQPNARPATIAAARSATGSQPPNGKQTQPLRRQ